MSRILRTALLLLLLMTAITGVVYPLVVTGLARVAFADPARGSLIERDGQVAGSRLIGQSFTSPGYFWSRPSSTTPTPYNGDASGGSNLGPTNPALTDAVKQRIAALRAADPGNTAPIPVDMVTSSASGLDPDISPAAADYQAARVARARGLPVTRVRALIADNTQGPQFGVLGESRVNVLALNLALDKLAPPHAVAH